MAGPLENRYVIKLYIHIYFVDTVFGCGARVCSSAPRLLYTQHTASPPDDSVAGPQPHHLIWWRTVLLIPAATEFTTIQKIPALSLMYLVIATKALTPILRSLVSWGLPPTLVSKHH